MKAEKEREKEKEKDVQFKTNEIGFLLIHEKSIS